MPANSVDSTSPFTDTWIPCSVHPGKTFAECFPECVAHEKALAEGGGAASNKNPNKGGVGKTGGKKKSKDEDLSALLSEGLSVGGKKKGKK